MVVLAAAGRLVAASGPHFDRPAAFVPHLALMHAGTVWFMRWQWRDEVSEPWRPGRIRGRRSTAWFAIPAIVTVTSIVLGFTSVPWRVHWAIARSDFERAVADHRTKGGSIGGLAIGHIWRTEDTVSFEWDGAEAEGLMSGTESEIVYAPNGHPIRGPVYDEVDVTPLGHGWYLVERWWD